MQFQTPLVRGTLIRRYKRFLADIALDDGETVTAHCANPGAMTGLAAPGSPVWLSRSDNPKRKLAWSWELVAADGTLVGINTSWPNRLAEEAIAGGLIAPLRGYDAVRREVRYGERSRVDLLLSTEGRPDCYVEIKNVHLMRRPGLAEFPDARTARGARHLRELQQMVAQGHRAVLLYVVQRGDCRAVAVAGDIDPDYDSAFAAARAGGVEALAYCCKIDPAYIEVSQPLPIRDSHPPSTAQNHA